MPWSTVPTARASAPTGAACVSSGIGVVGAVNPQHRDISRMVTSNEPSRAERADCATGRAKRPEFLWNKVLTLFPRLAMVRRTIYVVRCNRDCSGCAIHARFFPVFRRFKADSKVFLHRLKRRRLAPA
jgi:hypothetical protein